MCSGEGPIASVGDFNGDGYADLLYSGLKEGEGKVTSLAEYIPSTLEYVDSTFDVSDILDAEVEFGDLDGDGDLDFALSGESKSSPGTYIFKAYLNTRHESAKVISGSSSNLTYVTNESPSTPVLNPPTILDDQNVEEGHVAVEFSWLASTDDLTLPNGLTYAIKIGTTKGGEEIMSSNANFNGIRKSARKGNVEHNLKWKLSLPSGSYYWSVQAIDAAYLGSPFSTSKQFTISSEGVTVPPVASSQSVTTVEQTDQTITLTGTDRDNDSLTYIISSLPENGTLSDNGNVVTADELPKNLGETNIITYKSDSDYLTSDSFIFNVNDGKSDGDIPAKVSITITGVNDAPFSLNISAATITNTNTIIPLIGKDVDFDELTYIVIALPENGQLKVGETAIVETDLPKTLTQNELTYVPNTDYQGLDSIAYKVNDGVLDSEDSKVTITISEGYLDTQTKLGLDLDGDEGDKQGQSIAFNEDATIMAVGANEYDGKKGTVRVYKWNQYVSKSWSKLGDDIDGLEINDYQGISVSLSSDGTTLAVGANGHDNNKGTARVYKWDGIVWAQQGGDLDGEVFDDYQGSSVSLSKYGTTLAVGAYGHDSNKGTVRLYQYNSNSWVQLGADLDGDSINDYQGRSVSLSADGLTLAVGATGVNSNMGAARVYKYDSSTWTKLGEDINGTDAEDYHGNSISISSSGTTIAVGAWGHDNKKGTARVYRYSSSAWSQVGEDLDGEAADDYQGWSVSLSSNGLTLAVGAYGHESNKGTVRIYNIEAEKLGSANKGTVTLNSQSNTWSQIGNDIDGSGSSSDSSEERWSSTLDGEAGDKQGYSVSISSDGTTLAVGALGHDNKGTIRAYSLVTSNDLDEDGVLNNKDKCPNTPKGNIVDLDGCTVFTLPLDNNKVSVTSASCIGTTDGSIGLSIEDASFDYSITVTGKDDPIVITGENKTASVSGLAKGTYTVCFTVDGQAYLRAVF